MQVREPADRFEFKTVQLSKECESVRLNIKMMDCG